MYQCAEKCQTFLLLAPTCTVNLVSEACLRQWDVSKESENNDIMDRLSHMLPKKIGFGDTTGLPEDQQNRRDAIAENLNVFTQLNTFKQALIKYEQLGSITSERVAMDGSIAIMKDLMAAREPLGGIDKIGDFNKRMLVDP